MRNLVAEALANADAKEQAETFNEFVLMLSAMCKVTPSAGVDTQIYYIAQGLRGETVKFFRDMIGSWDYLNKEADKKIVDYHRLSKEVRDLERQIEEKRKLLEEV